MKRFMLFAGPDYYPGGGWSDFSDSFDTLDSAISQAKKQDDDWWHVVDAKTGVMVWLRNSRFPSGRAPDPAWL
jgi:hypothetical protein